jgi:hypothetical protein
MKKTFVIALMLVALTVVALTWRHYHSPEYALSVIDRACDKRDLTICENYMTPTGKKVLSASLATADSTHSSNYTIESIQKTSSDYRERVSTPGDKGPTEFELVLVRANGKWQFDDVYCIQWEGYKMEFNASFGIDHPYKATIQMVYKNPNLQLQMAEKFLEGFKDGLEIAESLRAAR